MKRVFGILLVVIILCYCPTAFAYEFNLSLFTNSDQFVVEFDEMDGSGEITFVDDCFLIDEEHYMGYYSENVDLELDGLIQLYTDIVMLEDYPPVVRLTLSYYGYEPLNINKVIMKPAETRYTFTVESNIYEYDGYIQELVSLVITDANWQLINDIVYYGNVFSGISCRLVGNDEVNAKLVGLWDNLDGIEAIRDTYYDAITVTSADEFEAFKIAYPCEIKEVQSYK